MKILNLTKDSQMYTSNVYLVTGSRNSVSDINTLIDVGTDPRAIDKINHASTGVGKKRVEQVILTHSHYDHILILDQIRQEFNPKVFAFSDCIGNSLGHVNHILENGETLKIADRMFEVIHTPGHSSDSICLFNKEDGILFAGDTPLIINSHDATYEEAFVKAFEVVAKKRITKVYFGHGSPLSEKCNEIISASLKNIKTVIKKPKPH